MKRRQRFQISTRTIKSAVHPLRPYIVATLGCFLIAWVLLSLSHEAPPESTAATWIRTFADAFLWIATAAAISHVVLFTIYLLRDARATSDTDEPRARR